MCGEVDLGGGQQIGDQHPHRNQRAHVPRQTEPAEEEAGAEPVDDMVDVAPVARALLVPHPREGAVETVTEPVDARATTTRSSAPGLRPAIQ